MQANIANRTVYQQDNLPVMWGMDTASVDLIVTDPPYNKAQRFTAAPDTLAEGTSFGDTWRWVPGQHERVVEAIGGDYPAAAQVITAAYEMDKGLAAYLTFLGVRLIEMRRVLKPAGSIYLHCDATAAHLHQGAYGRGVRGRARSGRPLLGARATQPPLPATSTPAGTRQSCTTAGRAQPLTKSESSAATPRLPKPTPT